MQPKLLKYILDIESVIDEIEVIKKKTQEFMIYIFSLRIASLKWVVIFKTFLKKVYQDCLKTLQDQQINEITHRIRKDLEKELGAELRHRSV